MSSNWSLWMKGVAGVASVGSALAFVEGCSNLHSGETQTETLGVAQAAATGLSTVTFPTVVATDVSGLGLGVLAASVGSQFQLLDANGNPCGWTAPTLTASNYVNAAKHVVIGSAASSATCSAGSVAATNNADVVWLVPPGGSADRPASGVKASVILSSTFTLAKLGSTTNYPSPSAQAGYPSMAIQALSFTFEGTAFSYSAKGSATVKGKTFAGLADPGGRGRDAIDDRYYGTTATSFTVKDASGVCSVAAFMPDWGFVAGTTSKVYLKNNSAVQWRIAPPSKVTVRLCSKNTLAVQCAGSTLPAGASEVTGVFNL